MKLITVSGPPSSGKTSVVIRTIEQLEHPERVMVVKFDCLSSTDQERYRAGGIRAVTGLSGNQCPDHFYITNVEDCVKQGEKEERSLLIVESAGLCNRCAPHLKGCLAVCVIDNLSGINTPQKIGPMLKYADIVVVTKGDIVSQSARSSGSRSGRPTREHRSSLSTASRDRGPSIYRGPGWRLRS